MNLIPKPKKIIEKEGYFTFDKETILSFEDNYQEIKQSVQLFMKEIKTIFPEIKLHRFDSKTRFNSKTSCKSKTPLKKDNSVFVKIDKNILGDEEYKLDISEDRIELSANNRKGIFYGLQTILQMFPTEIFKNQKICKNEVLLKCCEIHDKPRFKHRGMHLDVSRHFFEIDFIKHYIDLIAIHKMNVFHWHLTDDNGWRIEIEKYPKLQEISAWCVDEEHIPWRERNKTRSKDFSTFGGFYTKEEIREVVSYAKKRNITIIPEIEMPGHTSEVLAAYPDLGCFDDDFLVATGAYWPNKDIFCAGNEKVFEFLEDVLNEIIELFPGEYIHIGGDEANKENWKKCPKCQKRIKDENLQDEKELQSYFIKRIEKFLNKKGKKMIGWDEILQGGLSENATVMSWQGIEGGIEAAKQNHDVIMCPQSHCYFDHYQASKDSEPEAIGGFSPLKKVYLYKILPEELSDFQKNKILGIQGNLWTEWIPTEQHAEYMILPRMCAISEISWSPEEKNWKDFQNRIRYHMNRFENYCEKTISIEEIKKK